MAAGTADADRVQGLAHVHLNLLGWVGLAVVGTRGAPRGDVAALEDLLLRVSALVEARAATGQTGAVWQRRTLAALEPQLGREQGLAAMFERYLELQGTNVPVHTWPVPGRR